ncbi:MAG: hypothetical protein Q9218_005421 [Villophora microphyllina]
MTHPLSLRVVFGLLFVVQCTYQVDVTISSGTLNHIHNEIRCSNLLPGECCYHYNYAQFISVIFNNLQVGDVTAVWERRTTDRELIGECSGTPLQTGVTPGTWRYDWTVSLDGPYIASFGPSGASYVRLPPQLPPGQAEANWLNIEGMKALVWGGGAWITRASNTLGLRSNDVEIQPSGPQISKNRAFYKGGKFYASPPPRTRFPDSITVNGTTYTAHENSGLVYKDPAGNLLDLKALGG